MAMKIQITVFWVVTPCSNMLRYKCFRGCHNLEDNMNVQWTHDNKIHEIICHTNLYAMDLEVATWFCLPISEGCSNQPQNSVSSSSTLSQLQH